MLAWAGEGRLPDGLTIYCELEGEVLLSDLTDDVVDLWGSIEDLVFLEDGPITFTWKQTSGPPATFADAASQRTTATLAGIGSYIFALEARNSNGSILTNSVSFDVLTDLTENTSKCSDFVVITLLLFTVF
jgi:hypothetical protein